MGYFQLEKERRKGHFRPREEEKKKKRRGHLEREKDLVDLEEEKGGHLLESLGSSFEVGISCSILVYIWCTDAYLLFEISMGG